MFEEEDFPDEQKGKPFPLVEIFGHHRTLSSPGAQDCFDQKHCPFSGKPCEKYLQYGYGYCSVTYRADGDAEYHTYAVCDHRLDGAPVWAAVTDHFGPDADSIVDLVDEVVLSSPRESFDFVALEKGAKDPRFIAIETQAIDVRGGGVGPAWQAYLDGQPKTWRTYFTQEAKKKKRKTDAVAYGVNMANIYKRLGLQIAVKGALLASLGSKLYVVCQNRALNYLRSRISFDEVERERSDLVFMAFGYTGRLNAAGMHELTLDTTVRTTVANYNSALTRGRQGLTKEAFLAAVRRKASLQT